ncbi:DUF3291 domain-containing protein [Streptosporangium sp. NBC_01639]|uniref:DUF3291 domain-containing protein n=1 Tax=unclassified Streptosporangium TaxID=2632669 RepID=UPI002DD9BD80|nr:DUF3291 domain-containing protein [Streptosporangium sp. NBC_01756]WSC88287.1 DUF3291 domain-containing protein [Streptosporangium sp. NBC_01756]WTD53016.1 DUF3291 domain-containing protein [Streptosporangium sp. NBC_01639]
MPTIPWIRVEPPVAPEALVMASRLEVKSLRQVPGFLMASVTLLRQARRSPGALGVALKAELFKRTFWTVSAWTDRAAVQAYAVTEPHKSTMRRKRAVMRESTFVFWTVPTGELPITWDQVRHRLARERDADRGSTPASR